MVGTVAGDGAPRSLSDVRSSGVSWTRPFSFSEVPLMGSVLSCCCCFTLRCPFFNFLGLAVLADASAFAIVSHQLISFGHNWHYSPPVGSLANSHSLVPNNRHIPLSCNTGGRSLVMRALGGAITSPCSNDSECRRPTLAIFGLYPFLLLCCWFVVELGKLSKGTLWETASFICVSRWRVQLSFEYRKHWPRLLYS